MFFFIAIGFLLVPLIKRPCNGAPIPLQDRELFDVHQREGLISFWAKVNSKQFPPKGKCLATVEYHPATPEKLKSLINESELVPYISTNDSFLTFVVVKRDTIQPLRHFKIRFSVTTIANLKQEFVSNELTLESIKENPQLFIEYPTGVLQKEDRLRLRAQVVNSYLFPHTGKAMIKLTKGSGNTSSSTNEDLSYEINNRDTLIANWTFTRPQVEFDDFKAELFLKGADGKDHLFTQDQMLIGPLEPFKCEYKWIHKDSVDFTIEGRLDRIYPVSGKLLITLYQDGLPYRAESLPYITEFNRLLSTFRLKAKTSSKYSLSIKLIDNNKIEHKFEIPNIKFKKESKVWKLVFIFVPILILTIIIYRPWMNIWQSLKDLSKLSRQLAAVEEIVKKEVTFLKDEVVRLRIDKDSLDASVSNLTEEQRKSLYGISSQLEEREAADASMNQRVDSAIQALQKALTNQNEQLKTVQNESISAILTRIDALELAHKMPEGFNPLQTLLYRHWEDIEKRIIEKRFNQTKESIDNIDENAATYNYCSALKDYLDELNICLANLAGNDFKAHLVHVAISDNDNIAIHREIANIASSSGEQPHTQCKTCNKKIQGVSLFQIFILIDHFSSKNLVALLLPPGRYKDSYYPRGYSKLRGGAGVTFGVNSMKPALLSKEPISDDEYRVIEQMSIKIL